MEIKNIFTKFIQPKQFIFAGNDYLYILKKEKNQFVPGDKFFKISLNDLNKNNFKEKDLSEIRPLLMGLPTGILLNSSYFVFNLLKFEKIPFNKRKIEEIVKWRIERIFPEDQKLYDHQYYILNSEYILSVLIRKEIKASIDAFFFKLGIKQTYFGSSTIEIINFLYKNVNPLKQLFGSKNTSDFFIEIWENAATVVFQNKKNPFYIRKFNFQNSDELAAEIEKTIIYIKNTYNLTPLHYSLFQNNSHIKVEEIRKSLETLKLSRIDSDKQLNRFIDGVSL